MAGSKYSGQPALTEMQAALKLLGRDPNGSPQNVEVPWELLFTRLDYVNVTGDYSVTSGDPALLVSAGTPLTITIPTAQFVNKRLLPVKDGTLNASVNNITVVTGGSKKIEGEDQLVMNLDGGSLWLWADPESGNWLLL